MTRLGLIVVVVLGYMVLSLRFENKYLSAKLAEGNKSSRFESGSVDKDRGSSPSVFSSFQERIFIINLHGDTVKLVTKDTVYYSREKRPELSISPIGIKITEEALDR